VGVIEVLVKVGDTIKAEQSLITVESDKASMEIPSSHAGVVKELKVKLGDKVARLRAAVAGSGRCGAALLRWPPFSQMRPAAAQPAQAAAQCPASFTGSTDLDCDVLVLGGGPGGYSAAFRAPTWA
jgi:dihydrolipoamide dehydrogenase